MASFFAKNFRFLREEKAVSQTTMGELLGFSRASVDAYEDGRAMPPYPKLKIIADYFNLSIEEITEEKLWDSPIEKEIKRAEEETEDSPMKFEDSSETNFEDQLSSLNIDLGQKSKTQFSDEGIHLIPLIEKKHFDRYLKTPWEKLAPELKTVSFDLPKISGYRAFEAKDDFPFKNSVLVGLPVKNLSSVIDGGRYILVSESKGILYRRVYNQVRIKGLLILSGETSEVQTEEMPIGDLKEVWEVRAFMSLTLPEPKSDLSNALKMLKKLKDELKRLNPDD